VARSLFRELAKNRVLYLMFLPVAAYFLLFYYLPIGGVILAFKDFNYREGILFSPWNGLKNFAFFFRSGKAWSVTRNTVLYNLAFLAAYTFFSMLTAILISEAASKIFKKISQTFMFLPYFISWVVSAAFLYNFCNYDYGMLNKLLRALGWEALNIYSTPGFWYFLLPFMYVWKWVGFGTLPMLRPTMMILLLLGIGRILRGEFDMFYQLIGNNGLLLDATDIIDTLVFRSLLGTQDFGMAVAAGFYQSVLCFLIILLVNRIVKRFEAGYALF
jgi:putative aldouronate transport system permease protein